MQKLAKIFSRAIVIAIVFYLAAPTRVFAEADLADIMGDDSDSPMATPDLDPSSAPIDTKNPRNAQLERIRQLVIQKLRTMLSNKDGSSANIVVLAPFDYTQSKLEAAAGRIIDESFKKYGDLKMRQVPYELKNVTLEEFRNAMAKYDADILVVTILRNTTFDLYIYDRRYPYYIYAHSEPIPATTVFPMEEKIAENHLKKLVRRTLFHYARNQYYELPREETIPFLTAEIPRWIASVDSLKLVNREILSKYWLSIHMGAAVTVSPRGQVWNSNLLGATVGYRVKEDYYIEGMLDLFSATTLGIYGKKLFSNKNSSFKFSAGIGIAAALMAGSKTLAHDRTNAIAPGQIFAVPTISILYPIVDVYLKADARLYVGMTRPGYVFTINPGLLIFF
jgi:hypothetical protein